MKWIGLTGGIATGKSSAAAIIRGLGYTVLDADFLAKQAVQKGSAALTKITQTFGQDVLLPNGELDRSKMAKLVFADVQKREKLEGIIHPWIKDEVLKRKKELADLGTVELAFYDVPLLFEKNMREAFDLVVLVYCPVSLQLSRLMQRNSLSLSEAQQRIDAQLSIEDKKSKADFVIDNSGSLSELENAVKLTLMKLKAAT